MLLRLVSPPGRARCPVGQQPVGLLGTPAALGVGVHRRHVAEHLVHDLPGSLDGVLPGEQPALPVQRSTDQPVVGPLVSPGLLGERQFLHLRLPARAWLLAREREGDRGLGPDPEAQLVVGRQRGEAEDVAGRVAEPDGHLGGGDRHAPELAG